MVNDQSWLESNSCATRTANDIANLRKFFALEFQFAYHEKRQFHTHRQKLHFILPRTKQRDGPVQIDLLAEADGLSV